MNAGQPQLRARHDLSPQEIDDLEERIYAFNACRTGHRDAAQFGFLLEDGPELVGAVAGFTWGGVCEIRQLWVAQTQRGRGHGSALMDRAIEEARARGCKFVYLATYDFQAPQFYTKLGFAPVAVIGDKPLGHSDIVMRLALV